MGACIYQMTQKNSYLTWRCDLPVHFELLIPRNIRQKKVLMSCRGNWSLLSWEEIQNCCYTIGIKRDVSATQEFTEVSLGGFIPGKWSIVATTGWQRQGHYGYVPSEMRSLQHASNWRGGNSRIAGEEGRLYLLYPWNQLKLTACCFHQKKRKKKKRERGLLFQNGSQI